MHVSYFGDSLLLCWEIKDQDMLEDYLIRIWYMTSGIVFESLIRGIPFRGALSIGEFIQSDNIYLGPAIYDAASWYEMPDFIGVIATPVTCQYMRKISAQKGLKDTSACFFHHCASWRAAPLNNSQSLITYIGTWPGFIMNNHDKPFKAIESYFDIISRFKIPKGTENKYFNTERFFLEECKAWYEIQK
jgi:hypothetical protein